MNRLTWLTSFDFTLHLVTCDSVAFTERAFCHAAPAVWNSLPQHLIADLSSITTFKRLLKTEFYNRALSVPSLTRNCSALAILHSVKDLTCVNNRVIIIIITGSAGSTGPGQPLRGVGQLAGADRFTTGTAGSTSSTGSGRYNRFDGDGDDRRNSSISSAISDNRLSFSLTSYSASPRRRK